MQTKPLIILGSSRKESDTRRLAAQLFDHEEIVLVDLLDFAISHYSYESRYHENDKFFSLIDLLVAHEKIIFATPVYWYAMSGLMKVFFDRLTDIVTIEKATGRKLKGKDTFLLAVGADTALPAGFELPFQLTSDYLDMNFKDFFYFKTSEINLITHATIESIRKSVGL